MPIAVNNSLIPNAANVPLDARTVCANAGALASIENPYVGMHVWLTDPGKEIVVKTLTSQTVGAFTRSVIGVTEEAFPKVLMLTRPEGVDAALHLKLYVSGSGSTTDMTLAVNTATAPGRALCKIHSDNGTDASWTDFPSEGATVEYAGAQVRVDLSGTPGIPGVLFWRWEGSSGSDRPYETMFFPSASLGGGGAGHDGQDGKDGQNGKDGQDGKDGAVVCVGCLCTEAPPFLFEGMFWIRGGNSAPQWITAVGGVKVDTSGSAVPAECADFTIIIEGNE